MCNIYVALKDYSKLYNNKCTLYVKSNSWANISSYYDSKIINAYYSGAIPIYWGSSNINDFLIKMHL